LDRNDQRASGGTGSSTNISLSTDQELPLYLMGTKYLTALVETLKSRKNDEVFLIELNELDTEIAKARDDQALKTLKARKTSAPFLTEIHEINAEIARIKHDQTLRALQQRSSDDPFIEDLPEKINRASILEELSLQFLDIKAYTIDQAAFETRKPSRPSMRLIVIIGAMLSVIFALLFVSVSVVIDRRDRQGEMSSNYS
jgi:LPS O-antigen subunit length determinant protein (WzzB/FepE family)